MKKKDRKELIESIVSSTFDDAMLSAEETDDEVFNELLSAYLSVREAIVKYVGWNGEYDG